MRVDKLWMNVLVEFHNAYKVSLKLLKLPSVGSDDILLLIDDVSQLMDFSGVKIDSVLKIWALLPVLSFLRLVLVLLFDFLNQLSQISIFLRNLSNWTLVMELIAIFIITVFRLLDLRASLVKRKLTVL